MSGSNEKLHLSTTYPTSTHALGIWFFSSPQSFFILVQHAALIFKRYSLQAQATGHQAMQASDISRIFMVMIESIVLVISSNMKPPLQYYEIMPSLI